MADRVSHVKVDLYVCHSCHTGPPPRRRTSAVLICRSGCTCPPTDRMRQAINYVKQSLHKVSSVTDIRCSLPPKRIS